MTKRTYVGELGQPGDIGLFATLRAEATSWDIMDVLVQMWTLNDGGYIVRETDKDGIRVKATYIGPDEDEAFQIWTHSAFGA